MPGLDNIHRAIMEAARQALAERAAEAGVSIEEQRQREEAQHEAQALKAKKAAAEAEVKRQTAIVARDEKRQQLGESLGIGAACHIGHVIKLSGLSASSAGNGWDRATVWHIVMDAPLRAGRLQREPGDLLCRKSTTLSLRTMGVSGCGDWGSDLTDPDPGIFSITCKTCLERLRRFQRAGRD